MHRPFLAAGFVFGLLGVAGGAFGAHALEGALTPERLATFETGVRYQMYHALALILVGALAAGSSRTAWVLPGTLWTAGTVVFSGSLYALALSGIGVFGAVAPVGGVLLLAGWAAAATAALRRL